MKDIILFILMIIGFVGVIICFIKFDETDNK